MRSYPPARARGRTKGATVCNPRTAIVCAKKAPRGDLDRDGEEVGEERREGMRKGMHACEEKVESAQLEEERGWIECRRRCVRGVQ